jgi:tRNA A-37 threonylcarbamoyl transferase component Bud32/tetratricopeptide (TPR) repeat protein
MADDPIPPSKFNGDTGEPNGQSPSEGDVDPDYSGRQFGDYRMLTRIGRGGMADVYLAEQHSLQRQVAFKILKRSFAADANHVKRFVLEARAAAKLVHGNIVQIHEVKDVEGLHYMVQEYLARGNLKQWVGRLGKPLSAASAVSILRQVAAGLQKAAEHGIVHRDIKPENIMVGVSGEVKVADFGLARAVEDREHNLTRVGMTMGTPLYMSPEQIEGRSLDSRSDLYSLGVTLWHMLVGYPPFQAETLMAVAMKHLRDEPPALAKLRPDLPAGLSLLIHSLMAKDPNQRPQSPIDVLQRLRALRSEGVEEAILEELEGIPNFDPTTATARFEATSQLERLLRGSATNRNALTGLTGTAIALILTGCVVGAVVAYFARPKSLLSVPAAMVPRARTVQAQLDYAYTVAPKSTAAWEAVALYFPSEGTATPAELHRWDRCIKESQLGLAKALFETGAFDRAKELFQKLRLAGIDNKDIVAQANVGLAACHLKNGDFADAKNSLFEVREHQGDLTDQARVWHKEIEQAMKDK